MANKTWEMNQNQKDFVAVLKNYPNGVTLKDIEIDTGKVFKTGSVNPLHGKGIVEIADSEVMVDVVYRDVVIGQVKKTWKVYKLVSND